MEGLSSECCRHPRFWTRSSAPGLRESESLFAYYFVLVLHNIGLALLVGTCLLLGARLLGLVPELPLVPLRRFFRIVWIGFWLNMVSGVVLLIAYPTKRSPIPCSI